MKPYEELTLVDDYMFSKVMQDEQLCKELVELLLEIKVEKIESLINQKTIDEDPLGRGIRLDVYVKDSDRIFDIEIQTINKKDLPLRARYYQAMMDIDSLRKGDNFNKLKDSYIIFICTFDPFEKSGYRYTYYGRCEEYPDLYLDDKTVKVFYNSMAYKQTENKKIQAFLKYLSTQIAESDFTRKLESAVFSAKGHDSWRKSYMTLGMKYDEWREEGLAEGRAQGITEGRAEGITQGIVQGIVQGRAEGMLENALETAKNFLKMNVLSVEQIAQGTGLTHEKVLELKESLS